MGELQDIVGYIYKQYPQKGELSKGRITKLIYLVDWTMCLMSNVQVSTVRWYLNRHGPYSAEIESLTRHNDLFSIKNTENYYGGNKKYIALRDVDGFVPGLSEAQMNVIDATISKTQDLSWHEFTQMVNRTYPLVTVSEYSFLNLPLLAQKYVKTIRQAQHS